MNRGIGQRCPILALLYLFDAEILSLKLQSNNEIKGINISNVQKEIKHIQHADDIKLALQEMNSLKIAITIVENFCKHAGSKVNFSKTQCIYSDVFKINTQQ